MRNMAVWLSFDCRCDAPRRAPCTSAVFMTAWLRCSTLQLPPAEMGTCGCRSTASHGHPVGHSSSTCIMRSTFNPKPDKTNTTLTCRPTTEGGEGPLGEIAKTFGVNWPLFISQCIAFLIVALALKKFAYGPVLQMLPSASCRCLAGW